MNTKISEKEKKKVDVLNPDKVIMPGKTYFIILATTVILLLSFTVAFFAVFATQPNNGDIYVPQQNNSGNTGNSQQNSSGTSQAITPNSQGNSQNNGAENSSSNKTNPTRSNYISISSSNVAKIGDQIESNNVILVDLSTYESIAEKGADEIIYPASMTKVMSLLVACERVTNLNAKMTVTKDIADYAYKMGGSGFLSGKTNLNDELTIKDLLYLTSYYSDTIAVIMLANYVAGSEANFVKLMNDKARSLGLKNTNFANCTGLHDENNYSTCREIAAIMAYALENSLCKQILLSTEAYKIKTNSNNYTLWYPSWYGPDRFNQKAKLDTVTVKGGKTGYIDESGVCLVSYAEGNGNLKRYIQVIVGRPKGSGLSEADSTREVKFVYNTYAK